MKQIYYSVILAFFLNAPLANAFDHQHSDLTNILKQVVVAIPGSTAVDYAQIKKKHLGALDSYLKKLSSVSNTTYKKWNRNEKMAFLINAYNAFTIKLILNHYPVDSIKDIGGLFSSPWKKEFFTLLGKKRHLDYVEHTRLRPDFKEPRIHFAVNCASIGCPALRNEAFTAKKLDKQLEEQTFLFLQDSSRNRFNLKEKELEISKIFSWFEKDFLVKEKSVAAFVAPYISKDPKVQKVLSDPKSDIDIDYLSYDWDLNDTRQLKKGKDSGKK